MTKVKIGNTIIKSPRDRVFITDKEVSKAHMVAQIQKKKKIQIQKIDRTKGRIKINGVWY